MIEGFSLRRIPLQYKEEEDRLKTFLQKHELHYEPDIQSAFGVFDESETLMGCGCAAGGLLKCFAVEPQLRGQNALGLLISALTQERFSAGYYDLMIVTRAHNEQLFTACGMVPTVRTEELVMLENRPDGPDRFASVLRRPEDEGKLAGAIVMNCNPFTLGHRALAEYAVGCCEVLYIFVVEEDRSVFSTDVRYRMVKEGVKDLENVRVHLSGQYMISAATFPTYFLKENEDEAALQSQLDITLFAERIAPALGIAKRFAGEEPLDPVTAKYNEAMRRILPQYGIQFCEIPRKEQGGAAISASRVRALLQQPGGLDEALTLVPESTQYHIKQLRK